MCSWTHLRSLWGWSIALSLSLLLLAGGCRQASKPPVLIVESEVTPQPPRVGPATIALKLKDSAGSPIAAARVNVEANMSHAGMSPVFGVASEITPGAYRCPIVFSMAGDWIVIARITLPDGQQLEREFQVRGVRPD